MQLVMTALAVTGGMAFSLAIALLVEELIFGKVLRVFFVQQTAQVKPGPERKA
jgi:nitrate/nitrite transporter NarK